MNDVVEVDGLVRVFSRPTQEDCQGGRGYRRVGDSPTAIVFPCFARSRHDGLRNLEGGGSVRGGWPGRDNIPIA